MILLAQRPTLPLRRQKFIPEAPVPGSVRSAQGANGGDLRKQEERSLVTLDSRSLSAALPFQNMPRATQKLLELVRTNKPSRVPTPPFRQMRDLRADHFGQYLAKTQPPIQNHLHRQLRLKCPATSSFKLPVQARSRRRRRRPHSSPQPR